MLTVLLHEFVTGGGLADAVLPASLAAEGSAMRRSLAADLASLPAVRVIMTLDARMGLEPGPWEVERVGPGAEPATLARLAARADATALIAPETGGILAERVGWIERDGGRSLGSTPAAIDLAGDKLALAARLLRAGVPTPETARVGPDGRLPGGFPYPAVLKPADGAGSTATTLVRSAAEAPPPSGWPEGEAILQPFCDGLPLSVTFLVALDGRAVPVGVGRQRMELEGGRFLYKGGIIPEPDRRRVGPARDLARRAVAAVPGLRGLVGVDLLVRDPDAPGRPWPAGAPPALVLEVNPRPTTSVVGLCRHLPVGALAAAWIDAALRGRLDAAERLAPIVHAGDATVFEADGTVLGTWSPGTPPGEARP